MNRRIYKLKNSTLTLVFGNIINSETEVLVSSDDTLITMSGGVSASILKEGGQTIYEDAQKHHDGEVGGVVVTTAGKLSQKYIFHCLTIDKEYLQETCSGLHVEPEERVEYIVRTATRNCFHLLSLLNITSIAFPLIGSGSAHMPYQNVLEFMVDEISDSLYKTNKSLNIELYLYEGNGAYYPDEDKLFIYELFASKTGVANYKHEKDNEPTTLNLSKIQLTEEELAEYKDSEHDVFISYKREDSEKAFELVDLLKSWGIKPWIDKNGIYSSSDFKEVIEQAIESTRAVLFLSSELSNKSEYVKKEIRYAINCKKPVLPIMLDNTPFADGLRFDLSDIDQIDYTHTEEAQKKLRISLDHIFNNRNKK